MAMPRRITFPPPPPAPAYAGDATPLCPNCLQAHPDWALWCPTCNTPVSDTATIDPLRRIYSMGWMWRSLVSRRMYRLSRYGAWLYCGGNVLLALLFLMGAVDSDISFVVFIVAHALVHAALLYRITRNWRRCQAENRADDDS